MDGEERLNEIREQEAEEGIAEMNAEMHHARKPGSHNRSALDGFVGRGQRVHESGIVPRYYGELLTWALKRFMEREGWQTARVLGYHSKEPVFIDVNIDVDKRENLLMDGQILIQKDDLRFIVTVDINLQWRNSIVVEGPPKYKPEIFDCVAGVMSLAKGENFYRGKKIEFSGRLRFLNMKGRSWDSIILDGSTKKEIQANTIDFLCRRKILAKYGIPSRRGVLLAGEPGTGKTIVCKALMTEARMITCINASVYSMDGDEYLTDLYELADDLSPCIVFIEDIDLIGQNREEFGYQRGNALLSLLAVLDGVEEKKEIVTVATTNCLEILDKALSQRPSRFDRVIKLTRPGFEQRTALVDSLCKKIPLSDALRQYIAHKTEGCTPAQIQEVIHCLVIEIGADRQSVTAFTERDVDYILSRINGRNGHRLGFPCGGNHNGEKDV